MSLSRRILSVLILMIVLSILSSLTIGHYATQRQLNTFVGDLGRHEARKLAQRLSRAYTESNGWDTIDSALSESGYVYTESSEKGEEHEAEREREESRLFHVDRIRILIVDLEGKIILDNFSDFVVGENDRALGGHRMEVLDLKNGRVVGYSHFDVNGDFLARESLGFLHELLISSSIAGLLTLVIALLLATSLSKGITAPVIALTKAMQAIAQRNDAILLPSNSSDELGQMSNAFNQMTSALQRQRDLRKRLINDIAHELNTPLTVIRLEAKGLLDKLQTSSQAARHIIQEVIMLRNLANDLNWLAETDSSELQLNLEQRAIDQLLTGEVERWQPHAEARHISLLLDPVPRLPTIQLDPTRMRQALGNIIANALQHTEGGRVIVAASMKDDKTVEISVKDNGTGIAPEELPYIFRRYYRTEQSHGSGTGLGLDIARTIIEAHGGAVAVKSEGIGCGTTVQFRLPSGESIAQDLG